VSANSRLTTAVHALCWLELARRQGQGELTSEQIADSLASHPVLVRRVLAPLRDRGLLEVTRPGPGGGWRLTRPAGQVTLAELHTALTEQAPFALHPHEPKQTCPVGYGIRPVLAEVYRDVEAAVRGALATRTVADVLDTTLEEHPLPDGPHNMDSRKAAGAPTAGCS
jgi:DNA-binding IscR family transcriptional regulator